MSARARRARSRALLPLAALVVVAAGAAVLGVVATGPSTTGTTVQVAGDTVPTVARLGPKSFVGPGPFAAGEATLTLPEDGAKVEVWYPAPAGAVRGHTEATYDVADWLPASLRAKLPPRDAVTYPTGAYRDLPVATGRYPLVVFSHGFAGFRDQSTFLTSRLATWGFVVAAPDYLATDLTAVFDGHLTAATTADVTEAEDTIALMGHEDASGVSRWSGHIDMTKIAAIGHSLGGEVSEQLAAADPQVTTFIGMAGASVGALATSASSTTRDVPRVPGMFMFGSTDHVVTPSGMERAYADLRPPKRLVVIARSGHLVFSDICELAKNRGGLLAVAKAVGITVPTALRPLATDGCETGELPIPTGWAVIRQAVTAQLRSVFGFDKTPAGIDGLQRAWPGVVALERRAGGA